VSQRISTVINKKPNLRVLLRHRIQVPIGLVDMLVTRNGVRSVRYSLNWMDYGVIVVGKN
jgi:hypothetical protein